MPKTTPKKKPQRKTDFVTQIAQKLGVSKKEADRWVNVILDTLQENMACGIDQVFFGFGAFSVKERSEKMGRSPSTGESILIKAKRVPVFKAGSQLKEAVDQSKK